MRSILFVQSKWEYHRAVEIIQCVSFIRYRTIDFTYFMRSLVDFYSIYKCKCLFMCGCVYIRNTNKTLMAAYVAHQHQHANCFVMLLFFSHKINFLEILMQNIREKEMKISQSETFKTNEIKNDYNIVYTHSRARTHTAIGNEAYKAVIIITINILLLFFCSFLFKEEKKNTYFARSLSLLAKRKMLFFSLEYIKCCIHVWNSYRFAVPFVYSVCTHKVGKWN